MEKWADYCISKLIQTEIDNGLIDSVIVYKDLGESLEEIGERNRAWMVNQINNNKTFCSVIKTKDGKWSKLCEITYNGLFTWYKSLPQNLPTHKTFVSYYHNDDEEYRKVFDNLFGDLVISKSVQLGDIDKDNSTEYIKQLINDDFLCDATVLVVLIGAKTKCRKHVDWEIYGALCEKVGDKYAGVLGLFLPTYGSSTFNKDSIPLRLYKNYKSGYAILENWTEDRVTMQEYIERAFVKRENDELIINGEITQMKNNTCE